MHLFPKILQRYWPVGSRGPGQQREDEGEVRRSLFVDLASPPLDGAVGRKLFPG